MGEEKLTEEVKVAESCGASQPTVVKEPAAAPGCEPIQPTVVKEPAAAPGCEPIQPAVVKAAEGSDALDVNDLLKKVEAAAEKGAKKGSRKGHILPLIFTAAAILILALVIVPKLKAFGIKFGGLFSVDESVEGHDLTLENHRLFGYKAADFAAVVLGDSEKLKKVEVYSQELSDVVTITDTGLFNWSALTKSKLVTYHGSVIYTVDLSKLNKASFELDEENFVLTMRIPHAERGEINIPEELMEISDTEKGLLAFGEMHFTIEQTREIQSNARVRMEQKLEDDNVRETADRFAKMVIQEMYSPLVKSLSRAYTLVVEFAE